MDIDFKKVFTLKSLENKINLTAITYIFNIK